MGRTQSGSEEHSWPVPFASLSVKSAQDPVGDTDVSVRVVQLQHC